MLKVVTFYLVTLIFIFHVLFIPKVAWPQSVTGNGATRPYVVVSKRNPWAAFGLSFLLPSLGQFYNHEKTKGAIMLGLYVPSAFCSIWINNKIEDPNEDITEKTRMLSDVTLLASSIVWIWSLIDAPISAKRINRLNGYGLSMAPCLQLGVYPCPHDAKKYQVGLALKMGL